jgi:uncharacterized protein (TIGR02588 family)
MVHDDDREPAAEPPPPFWEWVCAGIGLLLLAASIGYLVQDAVVAGEARPLPVVEVKEIAPHGPQFLVRIEVRNEGHATAAALRVLGELRRGDEVLESSEVELDYVPGHSSRGAAMLFTQDPRLLRLAISARSWRDP